jgi:antitoxin HigA-1
MRAFIKNSEVYKKTLVSLVKNTAGTAFRLSKFFGTSPKFWLGLQDEYDLGEEQNQKVNELDRIIPIEDSAA